MKNRTFLCMALWLLIVFVLTSCGGGGGGGDGLNGPATVDASGSWSGAWNSTQYPINGTFSAVVSQSGTTLSGTISVSYISLSNATLKGTVHGSTITFGDINNTITFTGTMTGNSASGNYNYSSGTDVGTWNGTQTAPLTITDASPSGGAQNVSIYSAGTVTFSEAIASYTIDNSTFMVSDGSGTIAGALSTPGYDRTAVFTPSSPFAASTMYTVTVTTGVKNLSMSTSLASDSTWTFTTGAVPTHDIWSATSTTNAPSARNGHSAVWTGSRMIVWGGFSYSPFGAVNTGGKYDPSTNIWTSMSLTNAPSARDQHTAVWTGAEMIVWGGTSYDSTGARYNPASDIWTAMSTTNAPSSRYDHTAVWTGTEMLVWGGSYDSTGGKYDPLLNTWTAMSTTEAPSPRDEHTAVWTGTKMIVWGGYSSSQGVNTGGVYDPVSNIWTAMSTTNAPSARYGHTAIWTGTEMIVWGGFDNSYTDVNSGGRYDPDTDTWTALPTLGAPSARDGHAAVWTGTDMIVWGGIINDNSGGVYNPVSNTWSSTSLWNAPSWRIDLTAVWTGSQMIVWGGYGNGANTGGRYTP